MGATSRIINKDRTPNRENSNVKRRIGLWGQKEKKVFQIPGLHVSL